MAGNKAGGLKAVQTNRELYGQDFYKRIGTLGGSRCVAKGFALNKELARTAGFKGGAKSRRKPKQQYVMPGFDRTMSDLNKLTIRPEDRSK